MFSLSDFDFSLPPELIAQLPLPERSASRLLEVIPALVPKAATQSATESATESATKAATQPATRSAIECASSSATQSATESATEPATKCATQGANAANGGGASFIDRQFADIVERLAAGDLLVFNDTRVLKARFFGVKDSGGKVEVLVERVLDARTVHAQVRASKSPGPGVSIRLADAFDVVVGARAGEFYTLTFPDDVFELIDAHGRLPLPPYITHDADDFDETRYQTVYAREPGAVAAPTAGLHFDDGLLARLRQRGIQFAYVTLHVGAGTFQPVRTEDLSQHAMHSEWYTMPQATVDAVAATRAAGRDVVAVGTTSLRALESASQSGSLQAGSADTRLFITPGYRFHTVTRLITNFHLPKSTLLMLVSALAGYDTIRAAYAHAIAQRYRFFSYGDAMLLTVTDAATSIGAGAKPGSAPAGNPFAPNTST